MPHGGRHRFNIYISIGAQVVAYYFPKLVELHNYAAANAVRQKVYNWNTLNEKVHRVHIM